MISDIENFPAELIVNVCSFLKVRDLVSVSMCSKSLLAITEDPRVFASSALNDDVRILPEETKENIQRLYTLAKIKKNHGSAIRWFVKIFGIENTESLPQLKKNERERKVFKPIKEIKEKFLSKSNSTNHDNQWIGPVEVSDMTHPIMWGKKRNTLFIAFLIHHKYWNITNTLVLYQISSDKENWALSNSFSLIPSTENRWGNTSKQYLKNLIKNTCTASCPDRLVDANEIKIWEKK